MRLDLDQLLKHFQAFVVAGGIDGYGTPFSSVMSLLSGAPAWTPLASLQRSLRHARASIVAGRIRIVGGYSSRSEVTFASLNAQ